MSTAFSEELKMTEGLSAGNESTELSQGILGLAGLKLFAHAGEAGIARLEQAAAARTFQRGAEIITPPGTVLIIKQGEVSIFLHDAAGKKFLLGTAQGGDIVGEMSHLAEDESNDQKVMLQALTVVEGLEVQSGLFFDVVCKDPHVSYNLMKLLAARLGAMNRFAKQAVDIDVDASKQENRTFGERLADFISAKVGSWHFLAAGTFFTAVWMIVNAAAWSSGWDPYPFIFLNLVFSVVSAATMPVLLMSQNRQTQLDRIAARTNHIMTLRATQLIARVLKENRRLQRTAQRIEEKLDGAGGPEQT